MAEVAEPLFEAVWKHIVLSWTRKYRLHVDLDRLTVPGSQHGYNYSGKLGQGVASWEGFLPGSDRVILDTHPYFVFDQRPNDGLIATSDDRASTGGGWPKHT
ncbi:hypothetical protein B0H17DRAFT_1332231 [Mycena rosella]|uniref:Uncharacterized protein n=1 Tax=Mycena rosella TaxID=1033263 RepID=A0AAD7GGQ5_MYCRO|nr:hypothetical protein B0H17DRAFT_1332231 [Mycena rosella]